MHILKKVDDKKKYFYCNVKGHWMKNYPAYLATVKNKKKDGPSEGTSDMLVIKINLMILSTSSWVLDSGSNAHLYTSRQGLEEVRGQRKGKMTLRIDNGARIAIVAIGTYPL